MMKKIKFESYERSVPELLNNIKFPELLRKNKNKVVLKPNLTLNKKPPVTTNVKFVEEILKYIRKHSKEKIIIAEGSGGDKTEECFSELGYKELAKRYNVELVDLNECKAKNIKKKEFKKFKYIEFPEVLLDSFLISLPVLKEHTEAEVTISLKNMLGAYPKRDGGRKWKVEMHQWHIDYSIHDILACKFPDFVVCDASVGQTGGEISGVPKKFGLLLAGDPIEVDKEGCKILGHNWKDIRHLVFASEL